MSSPNIGRIGVTAMAIGAANVNTAFRMHIADVGVTRNAAVTLGVRLFRALVHHVHMPYVVGQGIG